MLIWIVMLIAVCVGSYFVMSCYFLHKYFSYIRSRRQWYLENGHRR